MSLIKLFSGQMRKNKRKINLLLWAKYFLLSEEDVTAQYHFSGRKEVIKKACTTHRHCTCRPRVLS